MQIEALYALKTWRENGGQKGLFQAATGIGKTFLAAFDTQPCFVDPEKKKIRAQVSQRDLLKTWKAFFAVNEN